MKSHVLLITIITQIKFNHAFYDQFVFDRFGLKEYVLDLSSVDISTKCDYKKEKCIFKCCPEGQIFERFKSCVPSKKVFSNVTVYDKQLIGTNKSLKSVFRLIPALMKDDKFARNALWWYKKVYLREDGKLLMNIPNVYDRWKTIETNHFCVEMKMRNKELKPVFMVEYSIQRFRKPSAYKKWALIVCAVSLILTLSVYAIVSQLRELNGILLMIHLGCLTVATIAHACLESYNTMKLRISGILVISFFYYCFMMSSLCWLNVIFYRLLKSRETKDDSVSIRKEVIKYSAYAVSIPFFMTIAVATIELSDMTDMPSFVTPQMKEKGNFSFKEIESLYYFYIPMFLILSYNWIVCFVKVVEFCKTSRQFAVVSTDDEAKAAENSFNRPMQFVKLLAVLTLSALLELLTLYPKGTCDMFALYTMCIGPIVMIIFVWKNNVRRLFVQRLQGWKPESLADSYRLAAIFHKK